MRAMNRLATLPSTAPDVPLRSKVERRVPNLFTATPLMPSNLKPKKYAATGPAELKPLIQKRMEEEHYKSESAYILGLILYDIYCRRQHKITAPLMAEPDWVRERAIEQIIEDFTADRREGRAREDGWFDRRIKELVEQAKSDGQ